VPAESFPLFEIFYSLKAPLLNPPFSLFCLRPDIDQFDKNLDHPFDIFFTQFFGSFAFTSIPIKKFSASTLLNFLEAISKVCLESLGRKLDTNLTKNNILIKHHAFDL